MRKYREELKKDSGKWIDSSVWHGKAHSWEKIPWVIKEVGISVPVRYLANSIYIVEKDIGRTSIRD